MITPDASALVSHCLKERQSLGQVRRKFDLVSEISKSYVSNSSLSIESLFSNSNDFCNFVPKERQLSVNKEGWRKAVIKGPLGRTQEGVFRDVSRVLKEAVKSAGGPEAIKPFAKEQNENGERVYSGVWNSRAAESVVENSAIEPKHLFLRCMQTVRCLLNQVRLMELSLECELRI